MEIQRRRYERRDVNWDANVQIGDFLMSGKILDFSPAGMCFTPEMSYLDGEFVEGADALVGLDGVVQCEVVLLNRLQKPCVKTTIKVRWIGHSDRHNCMGVGFEIPAATAKQPEAEVIPIRRAA